MKSGKSQEELDYAAECHRISLEVIDILHRIESSDDIEEAVDLLNKLRERFPKNEKRDAMFKGAIELAKKTAANL